MTMTLHDHHLRLNDLELALGALIQTLDDGEGPASVRAAADQLRSRGAKGAADLLDGTPANAAYRR